MAYELLSEWLLHRFDGEGPSERADTTTAVHDFFASFKNPEPPARKVRRAQAPRRGQVIYNFQYDLESVWWIILWTLLARVTHAPGQKYALEIYVNRLANSKERQRVFLDRGYLQETLERGVLHDDLRLFGSLMGEFGTKLRTAYVERKEQVMDPKTYVEIYTFMMMFLRECMWHSMKQRVPDLVCFDQEAAEPPESTSADNVETPESTSTDSMETPELTSADDVETPELTSTDDVEAPEPPSTSSVGALKRPRSDDDGGGGGGGGGSAHVTKKACMAERLLFFRPPR